MAEEAASLYFSSRYRALQQQLTSSREASAFQLDFEIAFALLLFTQIDGELSPREQLWEKQLRIALGWSSLHSNLVQNKVLQEPQFDLNLFQQHQYLSGWADFIYQLAITTALVDQTLSQEAMHLLRQLRDFLYQAQGYTGLQACEETLWAQPWINSGGWNLQKWQHTLPLPAEAVALVQDPPKTMEEALAEMDALVGLDQVKSTVRNLIDFLKIQKAREAHELPVVRPNLHMVFTGNPGTGKTTVARIVAEVYRALGFLAKGHLVETDRGGLVGQYVGHTEQKTRGVIQKALGGILFIDEAYALYREGGNDFGREAIDTLVKEIEDHRENLVVIVAGYQDEMQTFIQANPGLQSRFNTFIDFENYQPDELLQIFQRIAAKNQYQMGEDAQTKLHSLLEKACAQADRSFGNGRYVRNLFERVIRNQALRLSTFSNLDKEKLMMLEAADFVE